MKMINMNGYTKSNLMEFQMLFSKQHSKNISPLSMATLIKASVVLFPRWEDYNTGP